MKLLVLLACLSVAYAGNPWIIDGREASRGEFKSIVSLQLNGRHFCGGTLLNANTVLTAAHCYFGRTNQQGYSIVAGITNLEDSDSSDRQTAPVSRIILHPAYRNAQHFVSGDDVAVLKLGSPIQESDTVEYVTMASSKPPAGTDCQVVGWGAIEPPGRQTTNKKMVGDVKSITNLTCARSFFRTFRNVKNVCAGGESSTNACRGDSGGPLFCNGEEVGVVSYGRVPCGQRGVPTVYARVPTYVDWIRQQM